MPLDVLVPGLIPTIAAPPEMRALRLPSLEKWLARADRSRVAERGFDAWLAREFSLPAPLPFAPIALAGEGAAAEGTWMRADPVHIRIERDASALHPASALGIAREEADALVATLQGHFEADGLQFRVAAADRW